jgi:hypothetical protein
MRNSINLFQYSLLLSSLFVIVYSCVPLNGYHTGRTNGKKNWSFIGTFNTNVTPYLLGEIVPFSNDSIAAVSASLELQTSYGISQRFDLGIRLNLSMAIGVQMRYQLLGDQQSVAALSIGSEYGRLAGSQYVQFPLYFSWHPIEDFSLYCSPKYILEWKNADFNHGEKVNYLGYNFGIRAGNKVQFVCEYGIYNSILTAPNDFEGKRIKGLPVLGLGIILQISKRQTS